MAPFRLARPRILTYFVLEGTLIFAVLYGLASLTRVLRPEAPHTDLAMPVLIAGLAFTALLLLTQWGTPGDQANLIGEILVFSFLSLVLGLLALASVWIFFEDQKSISAFFLEGAIAVPIAVAIWRWLSVRFAVFNATRENVLIVGTGSTAQQICRLISANYSTEYAILGFADETEERLGMVLSMGSRIQTDFDSLPGYALRRADRVIVALDEKRGTLPVRQLMELRLRGVEIEEATTFVERVAGKISVEAMLPSWLIFNEGFKSTSLRSFLKRTVDLIHATVLFVFAARADAVDVAVDLARQWRADPVPANAAGDRRPGVRRPQVPLDAPGRRGQGGPDLGLRERPADHPNGAHHAPAAYRRVAPVDQRPAR